MKYTTIPIGVEQKKKLKHIKKMLEAQYGRAATYADVIDYLLRK